MLIVHSVGINGLAWKLGEGASPRDLPDCEAGTHCRLSDCIGGGAPASLTICLFSDATSVEGSAGRCQRSTGPLRSSPIQHPIIGGILISDLNCLIFLNESIIRMAIFEHSL